MNTTPTIKVTEEDAGVGIDTTRLLLQHAVVTEKQKRSGEHSDLVRKRASNNSSGASVDMSPHVPAEGDSTVTTKPLVRHGR